MRLDDFLWSWLMKLFSTSRECRCPVWRGKRNSALFSPKWPFNDAFMISLLSLCFVNVSLLPLSVVSPPGPGNICAGKVVKALQPYLFIFPLITYQTWFFTFICFGLFFFSFMCHRFRYVSLCSLSVWVPSLNDNINRSPSKEAVEIQPYLL